MWLSKALMRVSDGSARARDGLTCGSDPVADWDDLVLPPSTRQVLRDLVAQVRQGVAVRDQWGLGHRHVPAPGVAALLHGPRGTGKTLAARVIGRALRVGLQRVDLASVVSRYIGETERNLRHAFAAAADSRAILLFDEADALFGKRTEVHDSMAHYAFLPGLLRPQINAFPGLILFIVRREPASDSPMLTCLKTSVAFPFPAPRERAGIWQRAFPREAATEGLDIERLAQLEVTGGQIRDIANRAVELARERREPVRMSHLLTAVIAEYDRVGRPLTSAEIAGWHIS